MSGKLSKPCERFAFHTFSDFTAASFVWRIFFTKVCIDSVARARANLSNSWRNWDCQQMDCDTTKRPQNYRKMTAFGVPLRGAAVCGWLVLGYTHASHHHLFLRSIAACGSKCSKCNAHSCLACEQPLMLQSGRCVERCQRQRGFYEHDGECKGKSFDFFHRQTQSFPHTQTRTLSYKGQQRPNYFRCYKLFSRQFSLPVPFYKPISTNLETGARLSSKHENSFAFLLKLNRPNPHGVSLQSWAAV